MAVASLEIAITTQATSAVASLEKLSKSLRSLNRILAETHTTKAGNTITGITDKLYAFNEAIEAIDTDKLHDLSTALENLAKVKNFKLDGIPTQKAGAGNDTPANGEVDQLTERGLGTDGFNAFFSAVATAGNTVVYGLVKSVEMAIGACARLGMSALRVGADITAGIVKTIGKIAWNSLTGGIKRATTALSGLVGQFRRIFMMRLMRQAIMKIFEGFTEGLKNAVEYSRAHGGDLAKTMDGLSTSTLMMKNQIGAAFGGLIQMIAPALTAAIELITRLANAITALFAALNGKASFQSAVSYAKKFGEESKKGAKATKEWKNQLLGFDEINRLSEPSNSGGGSGSSSGNPAKMYETKDLPEFFKIIKELAADGEWYKIGETIADKVNDVVANLDVQGLGSKLGKWIQKGISFMLGLLQNVDFFTIGYAIGEFISSAVDEIDPQQFGALIAQKLRIALDLLSGLLLNFNENADGLGSWLGEVINGWLSEFDMSVLSDAIHNLATGLVDFISAFIKTVDWSALVSAISEGIGAVVGGLAELLWGLIEPAWDKLVTWWEEDCHEDGKFTILGFLSGIFNALDDLATWLWENVGKPFIDGIKSIFGIHSPSTVMAEIGGYLIDGLKNGIVEAWTNLKESISTKWEEFKTWWSNLSLPEFKLKMPHISVGTKPASGWMADVLGFFGMPTSLPTISVDWYAKGGIVNGATLIGAGEAGKEAIVPLENNTGWMDGVAERLAEKIGMNGNGSNENRVYVYLDGKQISDSVTKYQRQSARAYGV